MAESSVCTVNAQLTSQELNIPYWRIDSGVPGPTLLIMASQHGNEFQGAEVIRRLLPVFERERKAGCVLMVPFANLLALQNRRPHANSGPETPYGDPSVENINRTWPGSADGTDGERITYALSQNVLAEATHVIALHCRPRTRGPTVLFHEGHEEAMEMARCTAVRFVQPGALRPLSDKSPQGTSLRHWSIHTGRPAICIELSGQYMVVPKEVRRTVRAVSNCAKLLGLMVGEPEGLDEPQLWINEREQTNIVAPESGLFAVLDFEPSDRVEEGELLGHLISDKTLKITEVKAPVSGYLWRYGCFRQHCDVSLAAQHPYADEGNSLAVIVH